MFYNELYRSVFNVCVFRRIVKVTTTMLTNDAHKRVCIKTVQLLFAENNFVTGLFRYIITIHSVLDGSIRNLLKMFTSNTL